MKVKLTKEQLDLMKSGNILSTNEENYYYFPYWVKESNGEFELIMPEKLSNDIKEIINNERDCITHNFKKMMS